MNIEEENKAKEFYIKSDINAIHTLRTNMVEINYLDMLKLMHSYSTEVVKKMNYMRSSLQLKGKKKMSFGIWKTKCKDIEYIDFKTLKYKGELMNYEQLEKEYRKIKHTL